MLDSEEIKDSLYDSVIDGDDEAVISLTQQALEDGLAAEEILYVASPQFFEKIQGFDKKSK